MSQRMRSSEFLRYAAFCVDSGRAIKTRPEHRPPRWFEYASLTHPDAAQFNDPAVTELRPLRLMLAAAVAESEGD